MKRSHLLLALVLVLVLVLAQNKEVQQVVKTTARKVASKPVTNAPAGADGIVPQDPMALAREAGVSLAIYALARMLRSEHGSEGEKVKTAIGHAAVNYARRGGKTIDQVLLASTKAAAKGKFGAQNVGKYASTRVDPHDVDIEIARKVLTGQVPDPTGGAIQFDSPKAQRALVASGKLGYTKGPEEVAASRAKEGKIAVTVPGIDPDHLRFWRVA